MGRENYRKRSVDNMFEKQNCPDESGQCEMD